MMSSWMMLALLLPSCFVLASAAVNRGGRIIGVSSDNDALSETYRKTDYGALILDAKNFASTVQKVKLLVVLFYAPWCPHSQNFLVHYRKITKSFIAKKSPVVISEVDGSSPEGSPLLATESVEFYPQLVLYRAGMQIRFTGERLDMRVVKWIQELTTPRVISLTSLADASNALMKHQDVLMGFFNGNNTRGAELFMDSTIGIHDDVKRIVVQLNHPELTRLLPSPASNPDNEVIILLRKYSASSVEWAKIPMKLLRLRKEKELSALGAARRSPRLSGGGNDALPEGAEGMDDQGGQAFELPGDAFPGAVGGGGQQ